MEKAKTAKRYSAEVRLRAVWMVLEPRGMWESAGLRCRCDPTGEAAAPGRKDRARPPCDRSSLTWHGLNRGCLLPSVASSVAPSTLKRLANHPPDRASTPPDVTPPRCPQPRRQPPSH